MSVAEGFRAITERVARAAERAGRTTDDIQLVAVSKTKPIEVLRAALDAGVRIFGENRVQEMRQKQDALKDDARAGEIIWHMVGRLQKNKAKDVVGRAHWVHAVDSVALAAALDRRARAAGVTQDVLLQVNLSGEDSKAGVAEGQVAATVCELAKLDAVNLRGLMTMPAPPVDPEDSRPYFRKLAELARANDLDQLSMGMSADFEVAIEEGATIVRVGTAIFGQRG